MKILLYPTYLEKKNSTRYASLKKELDRLEKKIKNASSIDEISDRNIDYNKRVKRFGDNLGGYRASIYYYKDIALLVDFEIKQKIENIGNKQYYNLVFSEEEEFKKYIEENYPKDEIKKEDLSEYEDLFNLNYQGKEDITLFESEEFSKKLENKNNEELSNIFELMMEIFNDPKKVSNYESIYKIENNKFTIYIKKIEDDYFAIDLNDTKNLQTYDNIKSYEEILKHSSKAYPLEIFLDYSNKEEWINSIVKNKDGNIALSPEEEQILKNILNPYSTEKFPLFINGRAGSGKSTILQYLYAEYLVKFLNKDLKYLPIYLTYNEKLKEKAIEKVANIILAKKHLKEQISSSQIDRHYLIELISPYFDSFEAKFEKSFLRKILKEDIFNEKEKIEFKEIKKFLENKLKKSRKDNITPELAWYVIRSFIKGRAKIVDNRIEEFTPQDYEKLPRKLKNIKRETFEIVYNSIYPMYKNFLKENNLYDDLDLVIEVFKQNAFDKKFSVIFCDEAQDFTKLEFDLILNLNRLLDKDVKHNIPSREIPIAFAGDPFQTINPTGFSFEYLKALVFESYKDRGFKDINLNYQELEYNYRSNGTIIRFSNLIQLTRGVLFNEKIKFQKNWSLKDLDERSVFYLDLEDKEIQKCLIDNNSLYDIITPFDNLEDMQRELNDNLLKEIINYNRDKKFDTPIEVKGLEFQWVVLYRFGDFYLKYYDKIEKFLNGFEEKEDSLPYEYFFNNLYVGITRPKEKLFIVDSKKALNEFWEKLDINKLFERYKLKHKSFNENKIELYHIDTGSCVDFQNDNSYQLAYDRLKQILFERIDSITNPKLETYIKDVENILAKNENIVNKDLYLTILEGYKNIISKNWTNALNNFKKVIESNKLSNSENNFLKKISFSILWEKFDKEFCKYINEYKIFVTRKEEEILFNIIQNFCKEEFKDLLNKIIEKAIPLNKKLKSIILESVKKIKDVYLISDLYEHKYISSKDIIDLVKYFKDKDLDYAISLMKIDENFKKDFKDLYCELELQKNPNDIDCLFAKSKYEKIIDIIKSSKKSLSNEQLKSLLYYLDKNPEKLEILNNIEKNKLIEAYKEIRTLENIYPNIFKYLLSLIKEDKELIPEVMKIFDKDTKKINKKLLEIFIEELIDEIDAEKLRNNFLFNALLTQVNDFYLDLKICDIITLLEKTLDPFNQRHIDKLLGFYRNVYLKNKTKSLNKYKHLIGARYIKIMYELDKNSKEEYKKQPHKFKTYFDYVVNKIKFLRPNINEETLKNSYLFIKRKECEKVQNSKSIKEIYEKLSDKVDKNPTQENDKIIESLKKENEKLKKEIEKLKKSPNLTEIKDFNDLETILEEAEEFISNNIDNFSKKERKYLIKTFQSILFDLKNI